MTAPEPTQIPAQDFSILDRPDVLSVMFYPRRDISRPPANSRDVPVTVADGVAVHARWYPAGSAAPAVLFFHGNGEVVSDYDDIAGVYKHYGISLFAVDYRGYGASGGRPSFGAMLADALVACDAFHAALDAEGVTGAPFIMGRSLGALSAVEVAARRPERFRGLILESGTAGSRGWNRFAGPNDDPAAWESLREGQLAKLRAITLRLLSIHGERDELIPLDTAIEVQEAIGSTEKRLEVIPGAGHNDLMSAGLRQYFDSLSAFIRSHGDG